MEQVTKSIGEIVADWVVSNVGWSILIVLFLLSCFFKIAKKEIDPLGWVIGLIGKPLTKAVRKDIADWKKDANKQFEQIKTDRAIQVKKLQDDYNKQIKDLKADIDAFEKSTNVSLDAMKKGTDSNCKLLKKRMDIMEKSNDFQSIRQIRAHVLDFANSCMNGRKHTVKDFDNIFDENEEYEALCKKHKIKNHKYKADYEFIEKCYKKCQDENSFLQDGSGDVD